MTEGPRRSTVQPAIERGLDEPTMRARLEPIVRERFGGSTRVGGLTTAHIQRRLIRYVIEIEQPDRSAPSEWRLIGKVYPRSEQAERSFRVLQHVWDNGFSPSGGDGVLIPEPVKYLSDPSQVLMEEIEGPPFRKQMKDMTATPDQMRLYARAMEKLHRCPPISTRPVGFESEIGRYSPLLKKMVDAYPDVAGDVQFILESGRVHEARFGNEIFTQIHGDFHPGNLLINENQAHVLDLDSVSFADPARDLTELYLFLSAPRPKSSACSITWNRFGKRFSPSTSRKWDGKLPAACHSMKLSPS